MEQRRVRVLVGAAAAWMSLSTMPAIGLPGGLTAEPPPPPVHVATLGADSEAFFAGGHVGAEAVHSVPLAPATEAVDRCSVQEECYRFTFDVVADAPVLRLALDTPMRDDTFDIKVIDPLGRVFRTANPNRYSTEMKLPNPVQGRWELAIAPTSAEDAPFRVRLKLEATPYVPVASADGYLLPNLEVTRMWEFGFVAPANPGNGLFPPDDANPPLEVAGVAPLSCAADEMVDDGVSRCLRYSFGLANTGDGVFDIRWSSTPAATENHSMVQCLQKVGGGVDAQPAGSGSFHKTHGHWHYEDVIHHELFAVTGPGVLVSTGNGKKLGYSPADQGIAEWTQFKQANAGSSGTAGSCLPGSNQRLGMSAGWGDAYRYQRPGNFVDFGANGDGDYVVQTIADPLDQVREADETDNVSYAHLRIAGSSVTVLEVGVGSSPWDPDKTVIEDWWN